MRDVDKDHTPGQRTNVLWYKRFKVGDYTFEHEERSGRPSELNLSELRRVMKTDPLQSTMEMTGTLGVHSSSIESGLKKLGMKKKSDDMYRTTSNLSIAIVVWTPGKVRKVHYQHDNARPHLAREVNSELLQFGWTLLPHPPYSPDIATSNYWLLSDLTRYLEGKSFTTRAQVETELTSYFASSACLLERWYL
ncbi:hypothetical protein TELCIR_13892 [Teladorsagia circumcincta]|uniref:Transposase n=1 Tax=Teladorsagia circumcincta TaxID=45464 RepID=A0A2G9U2V3_TELCI|nr:hypothetical protein TELCIR_13892 [Teladorsagia circumcincta]